MIPRFIVNTLDQAMDSVVGDCNGWLSKDRFELETPIFAKAISFYLPSESSVVLDYGCGMGRIAKEMLKQNKQISVIGLDASIGELTQAKAYVSDERFQCILPEELNEPVDLIYCIYVLQHVPAIELRHAIERMHYYLKPGGKLVYCSSDYRLAINTNNNFTNDSGLGVNVRYEVERLFDEIGDLFNLNEQPKIIRDIVSAEGCDTKGSIPHPAKVYVRKTIPNVPYFKVEHE